MLRSILLLKCTEHNDLRGPPSAGGLLQSIKGYFNLPEKAEWAGTASLARLATVSLTLFPEYRQDTALHDGLIGARLRMPGMTDLKTRKYWCENSSCESLPCCQNSSTFLLSELRTIPFSLFLLFLHQRSCFLFFFFYIIHSTSSKISLT